MTPIETLEARLIAQRKVLAFLLASAPDREAVRRFLAERSAVLSGEEDPGAETDTGYAMEAVMAEEFRLMAEALDRLTPG